MCSPRGFPPRIFLEICIADGALTFDCLDCKLIVPAENEEILTRLRLKVCGFDLKRLMCASNAQSQRQAIC